MATLQKKGTTQSLKETMTSIFSDMPKLADSVTKAGRSDLLELAKDYDKKMEDWKETANQNLHQNFNLLET